MHVKQEVTFFCVAVLALAALTVSLSVVSAATSCTVAAGKAALSVGDTEGTSARVLIAGDGTGSFTDATSVLINCNVENVIPAPLEKSVKARLTLSQSTLAFRADCYYPLPEVDTTYTVGATVLPDNVPCVQAVGRDRVKVIGVGKATNVTQPECGISNAKVCTEGLKCKVPYVHDGYGKCTACPIGTTYKEEKCVKDGGSVGEGGGASGGGTDDTRGLLCLDGSKPVKGKCPPRKGQECGEGFVYDGFNKVCVEKGKVPPSCPEGSVYDEKKEKCVKKQKPVKEDDDIPKLPEDEEQVVITLTKKYTFIGVPFDDAELVSNTCENVKYYTYNRGENAFVKSELNAFLEGEFEGKGITAKISGSEECKLVFRGNYKEGQKFSLKKEWNFISPQTRSFMNPKNRESDCTFLSPFVYHEGKYHKEKVMKPGRGYLVKVKSDCTLSTKDYLDLPELPS